MPQLEGLEGPGDAALDLHGVAWMASSAPAVWSSTSYRPRRPEDTVLWQVLEEHLPGFMGRLEESGDTLPFFVRRELESFLGCGVASHGAALVVCPACQHQRLVPWSCKGRGFCPACTGRRMKHAS